MQAEPEYVRKLIIGLIDILRESYHREITMRDLTDGEFKTIDSAFRVSIGRDTKRVLDFFDNRFGKAFTRNELKQQCAAFKRLSAEHQDFILTSLLRKRWIVESALSTTDKGGRPTVRYRASTRHERAPAPLRRSEDLA